MRSFRWLVLGCATLLPALASAQTDRAFQNSWFWGAKAGVASFSTTTVNNAIAPLIGGEWLITRRRFGLYVAGDFTVFDETTTVPSFTTANAEEEVRVRDLRRVTVAGLAFPKRYAGTIRPYAGVGFAVNFIRDAVPSSSFTGDDLERHYVELQIAEQKDRASVVLMGGAQGQFGPVVPFGQVTWQPSRINFLLNGRSMYFLEGGVRINLGSAIERVE